MLLVDDILDEGVTLKALHAFCEAEGAASVASAVLVDKASRTGPEADFVGLMAPDRFLFGEGMIYSVTVAICGACGPSPREAA